MPSGDPQPGNLGARTVLLALIALALAAPSAGASPTNDNLDSASPLAIGYQGPFPSTGATKEEGEPNHAGKPGGASIWFAWTAPTTGRARITACGQEPLDTVLAVYTGTTVASLTQVASNDDSLHNLGCGRTSSVAFTATQGTTYRVAVDAVNGQGGWNYVYVDIPTPGNDDFVDSALIDGLPGTATGSNVAAGEEPGEPQHGPSAVGQSVWWRWTAPIDGTVTFKLCGGARALGVYTGNGVAGLTALPPLATGSAVVGFCSAAWKTFAVTAGTTYRIAVDGMSNYDAGPNIQLSVHPPPANDDFADAPALAGLPASSAPASNFGATS
jgi:hypothetical protein